MRMREGWEVWLLPNQATGKQGVPRYIKVDPESVASEPSTEEDRKEASGDPEQVRIRAACCTCVAYVSWGLAIMLSAIFRKT